ncbi:hypothetical protein ACF3OH_00730 [Chryseomicrobium aureum]|uniref:hypothetical protein n=1 Tax=Chryseomicrobium aureum TaxID=1441723 RepID=UPI00195904CA|nr:hypothetical protein [Chryseomicrobium aureum]MBM7706466.1 hypothetical protein [Chryseomicrobium aureum]
MFFLVCITIVFVLLGIFALRHPEEAEFLFERWKYKEDPQLSDAGKAAIRFRVWIGFGILGILWLVTILEILRTN